MRKNRIEQGASRYCIAAAKHAANEEHKRTLYIVIAGADEFLQQCCATCEEVAASGDSIENSRNTLSSANVSSAMRIYASTVLVMLGTNKESLLLESNLDENAWLNKWIMVFDYGDEDMRLFNEKLVPSYREHGSAGLLSLSASMIVETMLFIGEKYTGACIDGLKASIMKDLSAIGKSHGAGDENGN